MKREDLTIVEPKFSVGRVEVYYRGEAVADISFMESRVDGDPAAWWIEDPHPGLFNPDLDVPYPDVEQAIQGLIRSAITTQEVEQDPH